MGHDGTLACRIGALTDAEQNRRRELSIELRDAVSQTRELADGYAWRIPTETATAGLVTEFIGLERRCCPFFRFVLEFEPDGGAVWLTITGPPGVKRFIRDELGTA